MQLVLALPLVVLDAHDLHVFKVEVGLALGIGAVVVVPFSIKGVLSVFPLEFDVGVEGDLLGARMVVEELLSVFLAQFGLSDHRVGALSLGLMLQGLFLQCLAHLVIIMFAIFVLLSYAACACDIVSCGPFLDAHNGVVDGGEPDVFKLTAFIHFFHLVQVHARREHTQVTLLAGQVAGK